MNASASSVLTDLAKDPREPQRVKTAVAQELLIGNTNIMIRGESRYLRIKKLGLGVYEVAVAEKGSKSETFLVK